MTTPPIALQSLLSQARVTAARFEQKHPDEGALVDRLFEDLGAKAKALDPAHPPEGISKIHWSLVLAAAQVAAQARYYERGAALSTLKESISLVELSFISADEAVDDSHKPWWV